MRLIQTLIYSNLWISLAAVALVWIQTTYFKLYLSTHLSLLIFFSTYITYNYIYLVSNMLLPQRMNADHKDWVSRHKVYIIISSILALAICGFLFFKLNYFQQILLIIAGICSLIYVTPFKQKTGLRWFPYLKTPVIWLVWFIVCNLTVQAEYSPLSLNIKSIWFSASFLLAWILLFDLRDYTKDARWIKTWPQLIGIRTTLIICIILLITSTSFAITAQLTNIILIFISFIVLLISILSTLNWKNFKHLTFNFIFDGMPILWALFLLTTTFL